MYFNSSQKKPMSVKDTRNHSLSLSSTKKNQVNEFKADKPDIAKLSQQEQVLNEWFELLNLKQRKIKLENKELFTDP